MASVMRQSHQVSEGHTCLDLLRHSLQAPQGQPAVRASCDGCRAHLHGTHAVSGVQTTQEWSDQAKNASTALVTAAGPKCMLRFWFRDSSLILGDGIQVLEVRIRASSCFTRAPQLPR